MTWPMVMLGDVCNITMGQAPVGSSYNDEGEGLALIAGAGDFGDTHPSPKKFTTAASKISQEEDIILCIRATIGDINWSDKEYCLGRGVAGLRPNKGRLDRNYLWYFIESNKGKLAEKGTGSTFKQVSRSHIAEWEIPLPPLAEQQRIAAILDKADAIRRKRQQAIQLADDFLRAVFLDMFGDPVTNPKGWVIHKMSDVIDFKGGSQPPKETFEYEEKEGYIRLVQIRDFRTDKFKTFIPENLAKRRFENDDVMIGRYGPPVFQILRGLSGSYNVALMKAAPKEGVTKDFVYRLLQLPAYQDAVISNSERTAGQTGVNLDLLNNLDVPLPPLDIQISMSEQVGKIEKLASKLKLDLHDVERLLFSLSQKAFRGEL